MLMLAWCSQAVDLDEQPSVTYRLVDGDTARFSVDERSGVVSTRDGLDYERQQSYTLVVSTREASDNNAQYSATVQITVLVGFHLLHDFAQCCHVSCITIAVSQAWRYDLWNCTVIVCCVRMPHPSRCVVHACFMRHDVLCTHASCVTMCCARMLHA